ncbi:hypothetical protein [Thalassobacillus sp. CUG 92003]|uniref:hypothetical protein n=1 Tax=Thalassobacillus sp. CUG 92003 TaxID=2736641 RepID=UPI001C630B1C|nr:hypothetical protein [Thalassobacillus sp. CUG 92003]
MYGKNEHNRRRKNGSQPRPPKDFSIHDLFNGKNLDIVAAALLLTGKLKVDSVELYRGSPVVQVTLLGKFLTQEKNKSNALAEFLDENGDLTIDDIFEAFQQRLDKGDN